MNCEETKMLKTIGKKGVKQIMKIFCKIPSSPIEVERAERGFYLYYLREGMIAFDIGANMGELTLFFSRFVGEQGRVHAFEASTQNFEKLQKVCEYSGQKNIILNHLAVADREDYYILNIYDNEHSGWNSLANRPLEKYGITIKPVATEQVKATTIDAYCEKNEISHIDLLKIDVEGAEYQCLLGARRMLEKKSIHCCVFEFGQTTFDMGNNPDEIEDYLRRFGYKLKNIVKGNPVFPGRSNAEMASFSMHIAMPE